MYLTIRSDHGGGPFHVNQLLYGISKSVNNIFIAAPLSKPYGLKWKNDFKDNFFLLPHRKFNISSLVKLVSFIKTNEINIIHSHGKGAGVYSRTIKVIFNKKVKCVHTFHGLHISKESFSYKAILNKYIEKLFAPLTDAAIFIAKGELHAAQRNKINYSKTFVIYNGMDPPEHINEVITEKFIVLSVSRFDYSKNMELAYEIARKLLHLEEIEFIWLGDGPDKYFLQKKAEIEKVYNIKFIGFVDNTYRYFIKSNVVLSTSRGEGMPYSLIEALAFGKPIIATDVIGNNEMVKNGFNGFLYNSAENAIAHILKLKNNKELYDTLSKNAMYDFSKNYTKQKMIYHIDKVYKEIFN